MGVIARVTWIAAQAAILAWYLTSTVDDRYVIGAFALILSFPAGFVGPFLAQAAFWLVGDSAQAWRGGDVLVWTGIIAAGYWQWFVLLPRLRATRAAKRWRRDAGQLGGPGNPWPRE